jgi:hypothetical protein
MPHTRIAFRHLAKPLFRDVNESEYNNYAIELKCKKIAPHEIAPRSFGAALTTMDTAELDSLAPPAVCSTAMRCQIQFIRLAPHQGELVIVETITYANLDAGDEALVPTARASASQIFNRW